MLSKKEKKIKAATRSRLYNKNNPDKGRNAKLLKLYGITLDQLNDWKLRTGNVCNICKQKERIIDKRTGKIRSLAVDHDAVSGLVRGLLCSTCNRGIGMLKHNSMNLLEASLYIEYFNTVTVPGVELAITQG